MNNNKQESRLGKGLSAILGDIQVKEPERKPVGYINKEIAGARPVQDYGDVLRIPANLIDPNPYQPRMAFDNDSLEELAESVRTFGLIQPISVRKQSDGRYQIISGERRFRACKLAGMDTIPAYIRTADDQGMLEMAIVENIQRQDLDPIEVAMSYQRLMDECNLTQERMAQRVGKKRASIANSLRLLKLPTKVQHDLKTGLLSTGHAKVLLAVDDPAVLENLAQQIQDRNLSVRDTEKLVKIALNPRQMKLPIKLDYEEHFALLQDKLTNRMGTKVEIKRKNNKAGKIEIAYFSNEELERILDIIGLTE